jgi:hypothetical protein
MAQRERLALSRYQAVETYRDHNGRCFIAYNDGACVFIRDLPQLRRFLKLPKGLPMRERLDSWLGALSDQDAKRQQPRPDGLSPEQLATGFGPEVHGLDETDPNYQTRTVI